MYKYFALQKSNRSEHFLGANYYDDLKEKLIISVFNSNSFTEEYCFCAEGEISDYRIAISDDGELVATSKWSDYGKGDLFVYKNGVEILHMKDFSRIDWLKFDEKNVLVEEKNKIYSVDVMEKKVIKEKPYYKCYYNPFGDYLFQKNRTTMVIGRKRIKTSTFAYLGAACLEDGVIVSEVSNCAIKYDYSGEKKWETDTKKYGHIVQMNYNMINRKLYCMSSGSEGTRLFLIDTESGNTITSFVTVSGVIISYDKNDYVVSYNGHYYEICEESIVDKGTF